MPCIDVTRRKVRQRSRNRDGWAQYYLPTASRKHWLWKEVLNVFTVSLTYNKEAIVHFIFVFFKIFFLVQKVLQEQLASPDTTSEATGASLLHQVGH